VFKAYRKATTVLSTDPPVIDSDKALDKTPPVLASDKVVKTYPVTGPNKVAKAPPVIESKKVVKTKRKKNDPQYGPFPTRSAFELAEWYWKSTQKSFSDFEQLISIFGNPEFSIPDTLNVDWKTAFGALGANRDDLPEVEGSWIQDDGWKTTPIAIDVPFHKKQKNTGVDKYVAGNFRHRNILSVIKEKIANVEDMRQFHYQPYRASWKPKSTSPEVELYGELYSSRTFCDANEEIQSLPSMLGQTDDMEHVVVPLMFWSDTMKLTSFGGSTLWPCYLFFGNESKYRRCQPSEKLGQQVAYFIKVRMELYTHTNPCNSR
jgi:hypothetical protein